MDCSKLNDIIKSSKNILIISHVNPDGDTLGSMCGMYNAIEDNFKKKSDMLVVSKIPKIYEFLPGINRARHLEEFDKSREYDLVITVDVAALERICDAKVLFDKAKFTINIDHHKTNNNYADINVVDPDASSAGEILYGLMKECGCKIGPDAAKCLYTAIFTDTGSFRFDNATPRAMAYASELVAIGVSPSEIYRKCYESKTKNHVLFQAQCLSRAKFEIDDKVAYIIVYKKDMEKCESGDDSTEGLSEDLRAIITTKISFVVKQMASGCSRVSMRSKSADVADICGVFGGGGHTYAAGCTIKSNPDEAAKRILDEIKKRDI